MRPKKRGIVRDAAPLGLWAAGAGLMALAWICASASDASNPTALWRVVHDLCVTDMRATGHPAPCMSVDLARRSAVLKNLRAATEILLVPTDRVSGIESPAVLAPAAPNYWQAAWDARRLFEKRAGRPAPRDVIGLAVNSVDGRSQDQLHIHVDCIRPDVRQALRANERRIGRRWTVFPVALAGRRYRVRRIEGEELGSRDPFKLLAADPAARADMGRQTLVVIGAAFAGGKPGFVLLSHPPDIARGDHGVGEELLDHYCALLR